MSLADYDAEKAAIASIQRRLDEQLDTLRNNRSYSAGGRIHEMAKAVLAARARVDKRKSDFVAERETRRENLHRIVFGSPSGASASELIANRDAQDRAAQISTPEDAKAMLRRANQNGDESLARAVAERAFHRGWAKIAQDYADRVGKRGALDLLADTNDGPHTNLADVAVFRVRPPAELGLASESELESFAKDVAR